MTKLTALLALALASMTPLFAASLHLPVHHGNGTPMPGRDSGLTGGASIQFASGPDAQGQMNAIANTMINWQVLEPSPGAPFNTNTTIHGVGPDNLDVTIFEPLNTGRISPPNSSLQAYDSLMLTFSSPVAAVGADLRNGYRFDWIVGLEAFDVNGVSLGQSRVEGYAVLNTQVPTVFLDAVANADLIKSVKFYTKDTGGPGAAFLIGAVQIREAPEPGTWMTLTAGVGLIGLGMRRHRKTCLGRTTVRSLRP